MPAVLIDGKALAETIRGEIAAQAATFEGETGVKPGLADILVGDDPASKVYVRNKAKAANAAGFRFDTVELPGDCTAEQVAAEIKRLNRDTGIHGILMQLPVPKHLDGDALVRSISVDKDVDGLHPMNVGKVALGMPGFIPCTPKGVMEILHRFNIETQGRKVVIIGRSNLVGRPLSQLLSQKGKGADATVCLCHSRTKDLAAEVRSADIVIAAVGIARLITGEMVKPGAAVIDVGINQIADASTRSGTRLVGDVDFESVKEVAGYLTPVPGGVGPMTVAMLLSNGLWAARRQVGKE